MQGLHLLADLHGCAGAVPLADCDGLRAPCLRAVADSGLTAVGDLFHPFVDGEGRPQGVTGVVLLAESHLAIHTWPELRAVTADVYVCNFGTDNSARAEALMAALIATFEPEAQSIRRVSRGDPIDARRVRVALE